MPEMTCSWGDITAVIQGSASLSPGMNPDTFTIEFTAADIFDVEATADLTFARGEETITLPDCHAQTGSMVLDPQTKLARFTSMDFRWRWAYTEAISGEYNRRDARGQLLESTEKKTAQELLELLFPNLILPGSGAWSIESTFAITIGATYPYVDWRGADPAEEMHTLTEQLGGVVAPQNDGDVVVYQIGTGVDRPDKDAMSQDAQVEAIIMPGNVLFVGSRNLYQEELVLTAVGWDPDERIYKDLSATDAAIGPVTHNALPYKPIAHEENGWHAGFEDQLSNPDYKKAAQETVFRAYRLPASITLDQAYNRAEAMLRWIPELVEKEIIDTTDDVNEERRRAPYITGSHYTEEGFVDPDSADTDVDSIPSVPFKVDVARGIIIFKEPVYDIVSEQMAGATLMLVCAFEGDQYEVEYGVNGGLDNLWDTVRSDGVRLEYKDGAINDAADKARMDQLADDTVNKAWTRKYDRVNLGQYTIEYSGILDYSPDGWIERVSWSCGPAGPVTVISWNRENDPFAIPREVKSKDNDVARLVRGSRDQLRSDVPTEDSRIAGNGESRVSESQSLRYRDRQVKCANISGEEIPAFSFAEITDVISGISQIDKPSADSIEAARLVVTGPSKIPDTDDTGDPAKAMATPAIHGPLSVLYSGDLPVNGDDFGTEIDEWTGLKDKTGFKVCGGGEGRATVNPFSGGGLWKSFYRVMAATDDRTSYPAKLGDYRRFPYINLDTGLEINVLGNLPVNLPPNGTMLLHLGASPPYHGFSSSEVHSQATRTWVKSAWTHGEAWLYCGLSSSLVENINNVVSPPAKYILWADRPAIFTSCAIIQLKYGPHPDDDAVTAEMETRNHIPGWSFGIKNLGAVTAKSIRIYWNASWPVDWARFRFFRSNVNLLNLYQRI